MEIQVLVSRVTWMLAKSLGPWLSVWAIRYKTDCDYKLSPTARAVRWSVVLIGYVLAASLPGPGIVRVVPGLTGVCFLCWPNLAYRLTNFFITWPKTEGQVTSFSQSDAIVSYAFEFGGNIYGGRTAIKTYEGSKGYCEGQAITVAYDPFNPNESKVFR